MLTPSTAMPATATVSAPQTLEDVARAAHRAAGDPEAATVTALLRTALGTCRGRHCSACRRSGVTVRAGRPGEDLDSLLVRLATSATVTS